MAVGSARERVDGDIEGRAGGEFARGCRADATPRHRSCPHAARHPRGTHGASMNWTSRYALACSRTRWTKAGSRASASASMEAASSRDSETICSARDRASAWATAAAAPRSASASRRASATMDQPRRWLPVAGARTSLPRSSGSARPLPARQPAARTPARARRCAPGGGPLARPTGRRPGGAAGTQAFQEVAHGCHGHLLGTRSPVPSLGRRVQAHKGRTSHGVAARSCDRLHPCGRPGPVSCGGSPAAYADGQSLCMPVSSDASVQKRWARSTSSDSGLDSIGRRSPKNLPPTPSREGPTP